MAKRQYQLSEREVNELKGAYSQCHDGPTRTRYQAVRLYGTGYRVADIMALTACSRTSLLAWCQVYRTQGLGGLCDKRQGGNSAKLTAAQRADVAQRLQQSTPREVVGEHTHTPSGQFWTVEDLQQALQHWYGVTYRSRSSVLSLLTASGLTYQRPSQVFKSRRMAQVRDFEEQLEKNSSM